VVSARPAQLELVGATRPALYAALRAPELGAEDALDGGGRPVRDGQDPARARHGRTDSDPALLTPTLGPLLARALAADPKERYPDALAFIEALPAAPLPTETGAALATARGLLDGLEGARAAAEKRLSDTGAHATRTPSARAFARLAQRDELLAELRQAWPCARKSSPEPGCARPARGPRPSSPARATSWRCAHSARRRCAASSKA
jgi:hypothetical protein